MTDPAPSLDATTHRRLAADLFNHVWTLLELEERTPEQDDEMVHAAHASRYHWSRADDPDERRRLAVGEWQCSRVYAVLGRAEPALHHARRSLALVEANGGPDWAHASAFEALARASAVAGDATAATRYAAEARRIAEGIADADDRDVVLNDLATLPG